MRFGKTLRSAVYKPWRDQYIDYSKLKNLLREDAENDKAWTEDDETKFCDELLSVQLEKVAAFQSSTFSSLEKRANAAGEKLKELGLNDGQKKGDITTSRFREVEDELDAITNETKELKKYSSINYTGFLKIVKKHDRKRGSSYKIRPIMQNTLHDRPFNSEQGYGPLLNKLSMMYFVVRQQLDESTDQISAPASNAESMSQNGERYTASKFWIHQDNLLEVKTYILRRLPSLLYSEQTSKFLESQGDPTLNSLYFDNVNFSLYSHKVDQQDDVSSLRIRWYGQLKYHPDLVIEQKTIKQNGSSEEKRFRIKEKYIQQFIKGDYKMEKTVQKMERQQQPESAIQEFKDTVSDIQSFILEKNLQPILRANYTRTAFQKPLDDRVRISIDTSLAFIREDAIDEKRYCRNPEEWHRLDIDDAPMVYPFSSINPGEVSRFPYALLEIKVKEDGVIKHPKWVDDLMASHLVHKAPRFSKFVQGVASLFEDQVNNYPFWLSDLETDIRKDPQAAFEEEEQRKAKKANDEALVGSYLGTSRKSGTYQAATSSPMGKSYMQERMEAEERAGGNSSFIRKSKSQHSADNEEEEPSGGYGTIASMFPSFSLSRYAQARREKNVGLPPGVTKPLLLIKDSGPLQVEPKVWLANERTFLKWQHISVLLGALSIGLYGAAGENMIAAFMGIAYVIIAIFAGVWGYYIHCTRRNMIIERSGKDFDNMIGPMIISFALMISLILNFIFKASSESCLEDRTVLMAWLYGELVYRFQTRECLQSYIQPAMQQCGVVCVTTSFKAECLMICTKPRNNNMYMEDEHTMTEVKKKLFGLFRSKSEKSKDSKDSKDEKDPDRPRRRRRRRSPHTPRSRSPQAVARRSQSHSRIAAVRALTSWPPPGLRPGSSISQGTALSLIATGVPVFHGHRRPIPHASAEYQHYYATITSPWSAKAERDNNFNVDNEEGDGVDAESDVRPVWHPAFESTSFSLCGTGSDRPWESLEQPCMAFFWGWGRGTTTLNHWIGQSVRTAPRLEVRDLGVQPREVGLGTVLERLIYLEGGFEEDYEDLMYKNLYKNLLKDPDKYRDPHRAMEQQIADLIIVLSQAEWIDFSKPENQVVAKFFSNATYTDQGRYEAFFHQLLLSTELDLRIHSKKHPAWVKEKILAQLPPAVAWDLALARRWHECISIEKYKTGGDPQQIKFHLKVKNSQVKGLRKFARAMKWPNLDVVRDVLLEADPDAKALEDRSSDAMSYFTGMILPGPTLPWLVMNSLIDCDADATALAALTHMHPNSGFQYKSSTYWSAASIVGKVLAPTCRDIGGWIGPARPAPDLARIQIARIRQRRPKQSLTSSDIDSMTIRSDPLGPPSSSYPVAEYHLPIADPDDMVDTIRIEKLALKTQSTSPVANPASSLPESEHKGNGGKPLFYNAAVQFAIAGRSWPLRLSYDVTFIAAHPCIRGPHPLFDDYVYRAVPIDELLSIKDWGGINGTADFHSRVNSVVSGSPFPSSNGLGSSPAKGGLTVPDIGGGKVREEDERERVLVVEAFGVTDNEVLARAWCSHWGLGAVVADMERTCMACAIREAYAACLNVVVLIDGKGEDLD
ncbi:VTC domain-containing protein [Calycina marina]|uniref:VTC domain-containing protein n=1 Tax=Calycina marina TaxID=1763456 RepID=A0A9P8CF05_9HELO|nr:VTC domain-containing protein [Calycina marina]